MLLDVNAIQNQNNRSISLFEAKYQTSGEHNDKKEVNKLKIIKFQ